MAEDDPFNQLVVTLGAIEHYERALCLIAVYLGQRVDQNTIQGITDIFSILFGTEKKVTTAKVRGLITSLVNVNILDRERERIISSTKVSFHTISPLGHIALLYVLLTYVIHNPLEIEIDQHRFTEIMSEDSEEKLVWFLINSALPSDKVIYRIFESLQKGRDLKKIRGKPLVFNVTKTFSGKDIAFKIYEELIWDYLNLNLGLSRNEITDHFEGTSVGSYLNKLEPFVLDETLAKVKYYRLSTRGILILPILALMIKELSIDKSIFHSILTTRIDPEDKPWVILTRQARDFFKNMYRLP
ncbi:MAG: hypothetical protein ACFFAJ_15050 [Candidatus Hodarchaeota archaeon]